jgi:UPF0755 protein
MMLRFDTGLARMHGWIGKWLLLIVLLAAVVGAIAWHDFRKFATTPLPISSDAYILVESGDSLRGIVGELAAQGLTEAWRRPWWHALAWHLDLAHRLQVGEYALEPGLTPQALLEKLASGRVIQRNFTIVEGWTFAQLRQSLARVDTIAQTLGDQSDDMVMTRLGAEGQHPEGWFLPETYAYTRGSSDLDLLRRAHDAMKTELDRVWTARKPATTVTDPYQALILASIIEKETAVPTERKRIAGVFSRRLKIGMRLQTDPTVIYGLGSGFDGNLRRRDLDTDTPYNTYTRAGLPPGPIALPGIASLEAAVDPADGNELYFVARGDGSHEFSATYNAHLNAVRRYQLGSRNRSDASAAADNTAGKPADSAP